MLSRIQCLIYNNFAFVTAIEIWFRNCKTLFHCEFYDSICFNGFVKFLLRFYCIFSAPTNPGKHGANRFRLTSSQLKRVHTLIHTLTYIQGMWTVICSFERVTSGSWCGCFQFNFWPYGWLIKLRKFIPSIPTSFWTFGESLIRTIF